MFEREEGRGQGPWVSQKARRRGRDKVSIRGKETPKTTGKKTSKRTGGSGTSSYTFGGSSTQKSGSEGRNLTGLSFTSLGEEGQLVRVFSQRALPGRT